MVNCGCVPSCAGFCDPSLVRVLSTQSAEAVRWLMDDLGVRKRELIPAGLIGSQHMLIPCLRMLVVNLVSMIQRVCIFTIPSMRLHLLMNELALVFAR
jgi:hypothetical protein